MFFVEGKQTNRQEITRVELNKNGEFLAPAPWVRQALFNNSEEDFKSLCNCPWICPWPYVINHWDSDTVRVESSVDMSFWCDMPTNMLAEPDMRLF
jgi:hypothetical protein